MLHRLCIVVTRRSFVAMTFCCTCEMATYSSEPKEEREDHSTSYISSLSLSLSLSLSPFSPIILIQFGGAIFSGNSTEQFHQICCRYCSRIQLQQLCQIFQACQVKIILPSQFSPLIHSKISGHLYALTCVPASFTDTFQRLAKSCD